MNGTNFRPNDRRGSVLVVALVMLLALTVLMLSSMRANTTDERMAGNARDWNLAFQAAEAALRDANRDIQSGMRVIGVTGFTDNCNAGLCLPATNGQPIWLQLSDDAGWRTGVDEGVTVRYGQFTGADAFPGVAAQPRYIIEAINAPPPDGGAKFGTNTHVYRVTAVGFGASTASRVMLQAVYQQMQM